MQRLNQATTNGVILKTTKLFFCGLAAPRNWHHESPLSLEQRGEEADRNSRRSSCSLQLHAPGSPLDQNPEQKQTIRMSACCLFDPLDSQREINKKNQYESIKLKTRADICQTFNTDICTTDVQMDPSCSTNPYASNRAPFIQTGRYRHNKSSPLCCVSLLTLNYRTAPSHFHFIAVWFVDRKSERCSVCSQCVGSIKYWAVLHRQWGNRID